MMYKLKFHVYLTNFCVSKLFYCITEDALLQKAFTGVTNTLG